jgi:type I restriction enzyme, S subunit
MSFPRYARYKNSGVEWLGEVPEHWKIGKCGFYLRILSGFAFPSAGFSVDEGDTKLLRGINVGVSRLKWDETVYWPHSPGDGLDIYELQAGDLVIGMDRPLISEGIRVAKVKENDLPCLLLQRVALLKTNKLLNADYLFGLLSSELFVAHFSPDTTGVSVPHISPEQITNFVIPVPPASEQQAIVTFAAAETARIDALVEEQRRLIELLKEKRQAVISHVITKGLNPHAPMKPSGIEWLGDVPEHWSVEKMKWVAKMESGHTPDKKVDAYWENCNIPWVSLNDTGYLKENDYISDTAIRVNELGIANSSARLLPERVVVFSRDATIGRCAITTQPMAVSQHFIAWVCTDAIIPEYLLMRLRSMTQELDRLTTGATLKTIGMPDVRTLVTPVPPINEQKSIIGYIVGQTAKLDNLTAEAQRAIDLLQERRTALISAAVTGKIDVRGLVESEAA